MISDQAKRLTRVRGLATAIVLVIVGALLPGAYVAASAATYGTVGPTISNSNPTPGSSVNFSASGFQPNSSTQVFFESTPVLLETVQSDANGTVSSTVTIPTDATLGAHDIVVTGNDPTGAPLSVSIPITVTAAATSSSGSGLAFTGANIALLASVGFVALGFGGFLLLTVRRKHRAFRR